MRLALAAAALVLAVGPGWAKEVVRCSSKGYEPVTITLDAQRFAGRSMSCLSGAFVADLTPCAPNGAFALSAPTGSAAIVAVVPHWQDYASHNGGVVGFTQSPTTLTFKGGFNTPEDGLTDDWTFDVDRIGGEAQLIQKGKAQVRYTCTVAKAKF